MTYTAADLLALRRTLGGLEPQNTALAVERSDGINVDQILTFELRQWYLNLLDNGDLRYLAPENIASEVMAEPHATGAAELTLPSGCRRALSLKLRGWQRAVPVLPHSQLADALRRQRNPYTAANLSAPVAVMATDRGHSGQVAVLAWPGPSAGATQQPVEELWAAVDRGQNIFILDPSALSTLPKSDFLINI